MEIGLCRTNNSTEAWHLQWNYLFRIAPKLSTFVRKMMKEDKRWKSKIEEFRTAPANGIRGIGLYRTARYIRQDNNLLNLYENARDNYVEPNAYMRSIAHHL